MKSVQRKLLALLPAVCLSCAGPLQGQPPVEPAAVAKSADDQGAALPSSAEVTPAQSPVRARATDARELKLLHPRLGVSWLGVELRARAPEHAGVEVLRVFRGSPADGVLAPGDVLLSLEGQTLASPVEVSTTLKGHGPGEAVGVGFLRDGARRLSTIQLEGLPEVEDRARLEWIGRDAPEIASVVTFQGESSSLAELKGKVVVLEFWERYCGACRMMAPQLDEWHRTLSPAGLRIIGITMDTPAEGAEAAAEANMSYSLVSDLHGEITKKYHASQIPMLVVLDRRGVVRDVVIGYHTPRLKETERLLDVLLKERSGQELAQ